MYLIHLLVIVPFVVVKCMLREGDRCKPLDDASEKKTYYQARMLNVQCALWNWTNCETFKANQEEEEEKEVYVQTKNPECKESDCIVQLTY